MATLAQNLINSATFLVRKTIILWVLVFCVYHTVVNHAMVIAKTLNNCMPTSMNYLIDVAQGRVKPERVQLEPYLRYYRRVTQLLPRAGEGYALLGYCYAHVGETDKAIAAYARASALNPYSYSYLYNQGLLEYRRGNYSRTVDILRATEKSNEALNQHLILNSHLYAPLRQEFSNFDGYLKNTLAQAYKNMRFILTLSLYFENFPSVLKNKDAIDQTLEPLDVVYFRLGEEAFHLKQYGHAVDFFQEAVARNPDNPEAYHYISLALKEMGRADKAQKFLDIFDRLQNTNPPVESFEKKMDLLLF